MEARSLSLDEGLDASFGSKKILLKATAKDTGGAFSLMDYKLHPYSCGHALHYHAEFDKSLFVLEGRLIVRINDKIIEAQPGSFVFVPRMAHHDFYNPDATPNRFLMQFSPGGFEGLLIEMSKLRPEDFKDKEKLAEIRSRYDVVDLPGNWVEELKDAKPDLFP